MKKDAVKILCFLILLVLLGVFFQSVLSYDWNLDNSGRVRGNNVTGRNKAYAGEEPGSIDVLVIGTSEIFQGYSPAVAYEEEGITGYNFAMQTRSALSAYYMLKYALKHQTPKLVICDFMALFDPAGVSENDVNYRKAVDVIPDLGIRLQMVRDICRMDPSQKKGDWLLPILHYHSAWDEIGEKNFVTKKAVLSGYKDYTCGWDYKVPGKFTGEKVPVSREHWETETDPLPPDEGSAAYYDKLISLCREKGIRIVAVQPPMIKDAPVLMSHAPAMEAYLSSRGVDFLNYSTYEAVTAMGISMDTDYTDEVHMNGIGACKFTRALSAELKERYGLKDHRGTDHAIDGLWQRRVRDYHTDLMESQKMLYGFLECLDLYKDMPFVLQVISPEAAGDERYIPLWESLGIDLTRATEKTPYILRLPDGTIDYQEGSDHDSLIWTSFDLADAALLGSDDDEEGDLEGAALRCVTFYPSSTVVCSDTAYDAKPEPDDYADMFPEVRKKLF